MFSIRLLSEKAPESELGNAAQYGEIRLDEYRETFIAIIGFWSPLDYVASWSRSIKRLVDRGRASCLITSMHDPKVAEVLHWWLLYPVGDEVIVQNSLLLGREALSDFDTRNPYRSIPTHRAVSEEGEQISEWLVRLRDFRDFLEQSGSP
jgi:hypothetical protein